MYYYLDKKRVIENHKPYVLGVYDEALENAQEYFREFFKDKTLEVVVYQGDNIAITPVLDGDIVRPANERELVEFGVIELQDGEYIEGDNIVEIPSPSWQHKWDKEHNKWIPNQDALRDGEYIEGEKIIIVECPEELIVPIWDKVAHTWQEGATDLDRVMAQYNEYSSMDTPSTLKEMQTQDPALATELVDMLIELRGMIYSLQTPTKSRGFSQLYIPTPSQNLINFKNKFNLVK